jgi:hypothetical protein
MVSKYLRCDCKKKKCTLRYQYRHCDSVEEWQLFREGNHPMLDKPAIKKRGVPLLIIKFIDEFLDMCPELKPKGVHQAIVAERKAKEWKVSYRWLYC